MVPRDGIRGKRHRLLGPRQPAATPPAAPKPATPVISASPANRRIRVLFVCIGNAIRSQMAETFARAYGADVIQPSSAGVSPAPSIPIQTRQILEEHNLRLHEDCYPKTIEEAAQMGIDLIVNMTGIPVALGATRVIEWKVADPIGQPDAAYRAAAKQIEALVMRLILELRTEPRTAGLG